MASAINGAGLGHRDISRQLSRVPDARTGVVRFARTRSMAHGGVPDSVPAWLHLTERRLGEKQPQAPPSSLPVSSSESASGRRGRVAYRLLPARAKAAHVDAVLPRYEAWLGQDQLGALAAELVLQRHAASTVGSYSTGIKRFLEFCAATGLVPLEATTADILRYISWLALQGTVHAESIGNYLTSLNGYFRDNLVEPVALGRLVTDALHALASRQQSVKTAPKSVLIPARTVYSIYEYAKQLMAAGSLSAMVQLRNACATVFSFLFFNRSGTTRTVLRKDISVHGQSIIYCERHAKGKAHLTEQQLPVFVVDHPQLASFFQAYSDFLATYCAAQNVSIPGVFFALPAEQPSTWTASTQTAWLQSSCQQVGHTPPVGFTWTSHSLRHGAAAAARAERWEFEEISKYGGWAVGSVTLQTVYLRVPVRPCPASAFFFGWLKQRAPS